LATPYVQLRFESVASTQDVARERFAGLPLLVMAAAQTRGRGRSGAEWVDADRSLAVSLVFGHRADDTRPFSLMAGVAVVDSTAGTELKWPNDVMVDGRKVGGILVERSATTTVIGLGLNLWWPDPPEGADAIFEEDPGPKRHLEVGALWGAQMMELVEGDGWPMESYTSNCATLGRRITWEPAGSGIAMDVAADGALVVNTDSGRELIYSGAVRHVRS
jgi:BirA family biotin operon repressor/biotin-[acetyl-CoA-carboxylase] ligase